MTNFHTQAIILARWQIFANEIKFQMPDINFDMARCLLIENKVN
jgi:hypothetical protein